MARRTPLRPSLRPSLRIALAATTILAGGLLVALPAAAQNLPDTGNVTAVTSGLGGGAPGSTNPVFTTTPIPGGSSLRVDLNDNRTLLTWSGAGFNIASGSGVDFRDSRATGGVTGRTDNIAVLNRDVTGNMSSIRGSLTADPNVAVYLLNRAGVYIGPGAAIDVGTLFVSGLELADDNDFLGGNPALRFNQGAGRVVLGGAGTTIRTHGSASGNGGRMGDVVALGATVATGGTILADGDVGLVAAADVTVASGPGSPLTFTIARGSSLVDPFGLISAAGSVTGRNISVAGARSGSASGDAGVQVAGVLVATGASVTDRGVVLTAGAAAPGITFFSGAGNVDVAATGALSVSGSLSSARDMYLDAADPSAVLGSIAVARLLDLTGTFDLGSGASPNSGTISAAGIAVHGSASIWNPTTIGLSGIRFDTGALNLNAATEIRGRLAGTGAGFSLHGTLTVLDDIAVTTTGSQYWDAPATAIGSIILNVTGGGSFTLESLGDIRSTGGSIGMVSSGTVDARGTVNATQLLGIGSSEGTRVAHAMSGLDMSIRSDKDVVIGTATGTNALMANAKITVAAGTDVQILGSFAMTGSISGRNISLAATDPTSLRGSINASGLLDLTGTFDVGPASTRAPTPFAPARSRSTAAPLSGIRPP